MRRVASSIKKVVKKVGTKHVGLTALVVCVSTGGVGAMAYALSSASSSPAATAASPPSAPTSTLPPSFSSAGAGPASGGSTLGGPVTTRATRRTLGRILRILGSSVQGQLVVPTKAGGYRTVDLDKGDIIAVSATSITVEPLNGATPATAAITSHTREPKNQALSTGEEVTLLSSNAKALLIRPVKLPSATTAPPSPTSSSPSPTSTGARGSAGTSSL